MSKRSPQRSCDGSFCEERYDRTLAFYNTEVLTAYLSKREARYFGQATPGFPRFEFRVPGRVMLFDEEKNPTTEGQMQAFLTVVRMQRYPFFVACFGRVVRHDGASQDMVWAFRPKDHEGFRAARQMLVDAVTEARTEGAKPKYKKETNSLTGWL